MIQWDELFKFRIGDITSLVIIDDALSKVGNNDCCGSVQIIERILDECHGGIIKNYIIRTAGANKTQHVFNKGYDLVREEELTSIEA